MPYIITTTDPQHVCLTTPDRCGQEPLITRRAVATLDEARRCVNRAIVDTGMPVAAVLHWQKQTRTSVQRTLESAFGHAMRERGVYTIGPLPDRTVIEVKRITWPALALSAGLSYPAHVGVRAARGSEKARSEILAAASPKKRHGDRGA